MKCFYGEVHAHTTESDGKGAPEAAYPYAKIEGESDYFAVTDHNVPRIVDGQAYLQKMKDLAAEHTETGKFAGLYGYEMTYGPDTGFYGHANIINGKCFHRRSLHLPEWYDAMVRDGECGIGQFNHPGDKWGNFDDFKFDERVDEIFRLIELRITEYSIPVIEEEYDRALMMGWHVSPVSNEDSHTTNWTNAREESGCVLAEELTPEAILDGMRKNRTYATTDKSLKLFFKANGEWLGSRLEKTGKLEITVEASTEKACGIGMLQLVGEHNMVLAQYNAENEKKAIWDVTIPDDNKYVYLRRESGAQYAITAPVWVKQQESAEVALSAAYNKNGLLATAEIKNISGKALENVTVEWYPALCRVYGNPQPVAISYIGTIAEGKCAKAQLSSEVLPQYSRLIAVVRGSVDGKFWRQSRVTYLSPIVIKQIAPNSNDSRAKGYTPQPYCFVDIYNQTDALIDLSAYTFRSYKAGAYYEFHINRIIGARAHKTIWLRGNVEHSLNDFNAYYGTSLTDEDVYLTNELLLPMEYTTKFGILYGEELLCRSWIRYGEHFGHLTPEKTAYRYAWNGKLATQTVLSEEKAVPGSKFWQDPAAPAEENAVRAVYAEKPATKKILCLSDGNVDEATLISEAKTYAPNAEVSAIIGNNDGTKSSLGYFFGEGEGLLTAAAESDADTVLLSIGGVDSIAPKARWFDGGNFYCYRTFIESVALMLQSHGKKIVFAYPNVAEKTSAKTRREIADTLYLVAQTLDADLYNVPARIDTVPAPYTGEGQNPVSGALKIACVGDAYSEGVANVFPPYFAYLCEHFGNDADVHAFTQTVSKASTADEWHFLNTAADKVDALRKFAPDVIVCWFGNRELKIKHAKAWEKTTREAFMKGYSAILQEFKSIAKHVVVISPCCFAANDIRNEVLQQAGGMHEVVKAVADIHDCTWIDLLTPTQNDASLVKALPKEGGCLTDRGNRLLADLLAKEIKQLK